MHCTKQHQLTSYGVYLISKMLKCHFLNSQLQVCDIMVGPGHVYSRCYLMATALLLKMRDVCCSSAQKIDPVKHLSMGYKVIPTCSENLSGRQQNPMRAGPTKMSNQAFMINMSIFMTRIRLVIKQYYVWIYMGDLGAAICCFC